MPTVPYISLLRLQRLAVSCLLLLEAGLSVAGEGGRDEAIVPLGRGGVGGNINIIINIDNNFEGTQELRRTVKQTISESLRERGLNRSSIDVWHSPPS